MEHSTTVRITPKEKVSFYIDTDTVTKLRVFCAQTRQRPGSLIEQILKDFLASK